MYTDKGTLQRYLAVDIESDYDSLITQWIEAATKWINRYVGFSFEITVREDRFYDGSQTCKQETDRFFGSMTVEILNPDGTVHTTLTEGQSNDYLAYPLNETQKNHLVLANAASIGVFPGRRSSVKVNAKFGHSSSVPEDVGLVATKLVAAIFNEAIKGGKVSSQEIGDQKITFMKIDEMAEAMGIYQTLEQYRDVEI